MATTVGEIIRSSLRKIGVLAAGEALPPEEGDDALNVFRQMIDSWALETLLIPVVGVVTHTLVQGQPEYTIGIYPEPKPDPLPLNHIETARPEKIISAFIRDAAGTDYPQKAIATKAYTRISRKTNEARPSSFYMREGWPLNTILFESVPYASEVLHLEVMQPLSGILPAANLQEAINLPPGYEKALIFNLCLDLADEWGKEVSRTVAVQAVEQKKWIKRANYRPLVLSMDKSLVSRDRANGTYIIEQGPG